MSYLDLVGEQEPLFEPPAPVVQAPSGIVQLTDRLHDAGHVDLSLAVLEQYFTLRALIDTCEAKLDGRSTPGDRGL